MFDMSSHEENKFLGKVRLLKDLMFTVYEELIRAIIFFMISC